MLDLFGHEHPEPAPRSHAGPKVQLDLLTHAAERAALASGRPVSQERTTIVAPTPIELPTCAIHKTPLLLEAGSWPRRMSCPRCA